MADENKDLQPVDPSATADETTETAAVPDATGDDGQQTLPGLEGDAAPKPEDAAGDTSPAGDTDTAATEADPTTPAPAADEAPGSSTSPTPDAEGSSDEPANTPAPAGVEDPATEAPASAIDPSATTEAPVDEAAPAPTVSDVASPEAAAPAEDPATSTSTGIGGDKAADVTPPEAPKEEAAPAPSPAPSSPGLFDHGSPVRVPDTSVPCDQGYPLAQEGVAPVHPQGFHTLVNDGVGEDAGKAASPPEYPMPAGAVEVVAEATEQTSGDDKQDDKSQSQISDIAGYENEGVDSEAEPSGVPPHVEHKLAKLFKKVVSLEEKIEKLLREFIG